MTMRTHAIATDAPTRTGLRSTGLPALAAAMLGLAVLFGVGFAQPNAMHNAAHDGRHVIAFPCH